MYAFVQDSIMTVFIDTLYRNSFFRTVLLVEKCFHHSTSSFIFVYKQMSGVIICSD